MSHFRHIPFYLTRNKLSSPNFGYQNLFQRVHYSKSSKNMPGQEEINAIKDTVSGSPAKRAQEEINAIKDTVSGSPAKIAKIDHSGTKLSSGQVRLRFAKLTEKAFTPTKGSKQAAGFDLCSAYDYVVPKKGKILAKTDIQIALPDGCYGRVAPRSGLAYKKFIDVGAGVIDQDYRGNVGVVMFNFSDEDFTVKAGDRIAQLILERIYTPDLEECEELDPTERGSGGYGSTGTK